MIQKMKNIIKVKIFGDDIDLSSVTNIKCYVSQGSLNFSYDGDYVEGTNNVVSFEIPYDDAMQLATGCAEVQVCYIDEHDVPHATEPIHADVRRLIFPEGYRV